MPRKLARLLQFTIDVLLTRNLNMDKTFRKAILVASVSWPLASPAGGLYMYEIGTSDLGFAAAGTAARAEDASTVFANPAGMTRLAGNQMALGVQALYGDVEYELDGQGALAGSDPGNVIGWFPGASAFYSHSVSDRFKLGIGTYGNFGLAMDFGDSWAGRNLVGETALIAMTLQPTAAYRLDDHWSLGAGVTANYGYFKLEREPLLPGDTRSQDDGDWDFGARLGVLYEPTPSTRIGLTWVSEAEYEFDVNGTVTIGPLTHTIPLAAGITAPQQVMGSVYHRLNDRWAVMGNLGWQDWSEFAEATLETDNLGTVTSNMMLQDTWHAAVGVQYTLDEKTRLNAGVAFDTSMYEDQSQSSFTIPNGETWRLGAGMQYALSPQSDLGVAVEYVDSEESASPSALVSGSYVDPTMVFMSVHYSHRF
jgi:long-chain fatty acid transport protein